MVNLKIYFMIRDGYGPNDIVEKLGIKRGALYRAKRKYEKEMGVTVNWKKAKANPVTAAIA